MSTVPQQTNRTTSGLLYGVTCYGIWGLFPIYVQQLKFASALEIVANRVLWSLLLCMLLLMALRRFAEFLAVLRNPRQFGLLAIAAALIACNWLTYVYATNSGQVLQAALGYFINPLLSILLGVFVLRERLRPAQWLAVGIGLLAIGVIAFGQGQPPWLALAMAVSFGLYGLTKKFAGRSVAPIPSLAVETLLLMPLAVLMLAWLGDHGQSHFTRAGWSSALLLASTGIATTVPLVCFAAAARRLPLSTLGMLQYLGPVLIFIIAVVFQHEPMSPARWTGFGLIWLALILVTLDALRAQRQRRRASLEAANLEPAV